MIKPPENPRFTVVSAETTGLDLPAGLGEAGRAFWIKVQAEYGIRDLGGLALLEQAAACLDRLETLTAVISADGPVVRSRSGVVKAHPALQSEIQNRALFSRLIERLGISVEPVKPQGHPTRPMGWTGDR